MIQEILTVVTVCGAFIYTIYSAWKTIFSNEKHACGGCPSCEAKDLLLKDIYKKGKKSEFKTFRPSRS